MSIPILESCEILYHPRDPRFAESIRQFQGCPTIAATPGGRLYAGWYSGGTTEPHIDNYNLLIYSDDRGKSWSEPLLVIPGSRERCVHALDIQLWVDPLGRLWVFWVQEYSRPAVESDALVVDGYAFGLDKVHGEWAMVSDDPDVENPRFSAPRRLDDGFLRNKPLALSDGRWMAFNYDQVTDRYGYSVSADQGATWTRSYGARKVPTPFDEAMAVEKHNGEIHMLARADHALGALAQSVSRDGGRTWEDAVLTDFADPSTRFFYSRTPGGNLLLIRNDHREKRRNLTAFLSEDDGKTWPFRVLIDSRDEVSYPDAAFLEGKIFILYDRERTGAREILLHVLTEEDIRAGRAGESRIISKSSAIQQEESIMNYESVSSALEELRAREGKHSALNHAMGVLSVDAVTAAPKDTAEGRGRTMGVLSAMEYELTASPENEALLSYLEAHAEELDAQAKREVELLRKEYLQISRIPQDEYVQYAMLINDAGSVWEKAKNANDFASFAPYLEKIIAFNRKFAGYYNPSMAPYDALLNEYEEGLNMETLDAFFGALRAKLVPLIEKIKAAAPVDDSFLHRNYPVWQQRRLSDCLMDILKLDRAHCALGETEHPFTSGFNNKDVRITTHYHEDDLDSSMYSVIHEGGHALYELGGDDKYNYTVLSGGVSMGIHESQSRFFENIIGRSPAFIGFLFPKVKEIFPEQLADVDAEMFCRGVNRVSPSLIRTEADELTYCLHIMVRYELEKRLIAGTLAVADVPGEWNRMYREYLGVEVPSDREGCLQDSHWSGGMIGYFPSYALGSAYGAQMLRVMEKELGDIWADVAKGDLTKIESWLKEHFHRYASLYRPGELFERTCGKFDPTYYTDYLEEKYAFLYSL